MAPGYTMFYETDEVGEVKWRITRVVRSRVATTDDTGEARSRCAQGA